ncbi:unnamed protein product [Ostreobium quekettii]|uniref:Glucanase n=1 Tax=Ostreobium quekettii TaxID=121088 RepID=A0A8S1J273_9CHLO|nr:unnamed protein product [Ostreobium quekettii]
MARSVAAARVALLLLAGALAIASAQDKPCCFYGGCGGCLEGVGDEHWCGASEDRCRQCSGDWCLAGAGVDPFADQSVPKPVTSGPASCCYYSPSGDMCGDCQSKATGSEWCAQSESQCRQCSGTWCSGGPKVPDAPVPSPNPPSASPQPPSPSPLPPSPTPDPRPPANNVPPPPGNPFVGKPMYINPTFSENIASSIATAAPGLEQDNLKVMAGVPSAYWLDTMAKVVPTDDATTLTAAGILKDASTQSPVPLVTLIVYDLPNRDCHAKLPNCSLASGNRDDPKCGSRATETAYKEGIAYAIKTLNAACPEAVQYLDGAHGGWLGWENNAAAFAEDVGSLGVAHLLRGFSQNVANIQELGLACPQAGWCVGGKNQGDPCCADPCGISAEYNPGHNELNYAVVLHDAMVKAIPGFDPHMIIDTGRNARSPRTDCGNWCNARDAGTGVLPTTATAIPDIIDAYLWLKTPGESDGCTEVLPTGEFCPRFDLFCGSVDSIGSRPGEPRAPEAGDWFDYQVKMLARNAKFQ